MGVVNQASIINGNNVGALVYSGSTKRPVAHLQSINWSDGTELKEFTSKDTYPSKGVYATTDSSSVSMKFYLTDSVTGSTLQYSDLKAIKDAHTLSVWEFGVYSGSSPSWGMSTAYPILTASAYIETLDVEAGEDLATVSMNLKVSGPLTLSL
jgi:hypothetical protein